VQLDVSDEASILKAAEELKSTPIDLVINNAGILYGHDLKTTTKEDLMKQFEINSVGPFLVTRAFLPNLKQAVSDKGGAIVAQVTSRMGSVEDNTSGGYYGYRASKSALNMLNKSLSIDLKGEKITSLLLHPGYVKTDMVNNMGNVEPADTAASMAKIIENSKLSDSGKFYHFEGNILPW
jgi:RNA-binding protein with serine-rich domain 1